MTDHSLEELTHQINQQKGRIGGLYGELASAEARLRALTEAFDSKKYNVRVGAEVTFKGKPYRVALIESRSWGGKPWISGNPKKKDGTYGNARRNLFSDWEVINAD